ncbi:MAG: PQQ-binding-like beta-propeller repeat protein [Planctomycetaceae bacterium]|nr:PQQ-binding-like beta-propeller repeat protein [Planctomycetaceae bacterium]
MHRLNRRGWLQAASLFVACHFATDCSTTNSSGILDDVVDDKFDWPDFLGPQRNGISAQPVRQRDWANLKLRWHRLLGEGYTVGSCVGERFVQTDRLGDQERTFCWNTLTGEVLWEQSRPTDYADMYGYDGGPRCSPVLTPETVLTYGVDGVLIARSLDDGQVQWQRDLNRDYNVIQNFFGVGSAPVLYRDRLWVMVGGSPEADRNVAPGALDRVRPNGTALVALSLKTGETLHELGDDLASYSSPLIVALPTDIAAGSPESPRAGKSVGLAFCRGGLLAFDPDTGTQHFHFPFRSSLLESVNAATPVVVGNQVLLSETYSVGSVLLELNPQKLAQPQVVWQDEPNDRQQSLQAHWNTPVVHEGYIYASSGRNTGNAELRCVEWKTGRVQWSQPGLTRCSLTKAAGDDLVVLSERGELFLLKANPERYERITTHRFAEVGRQLRYPAWASPVLAQGSLFCRDKQGVYCFEV